MAIYLTDYIKYAKNVARQIGAFPLFALNPNSDEARATAAEVDEQLQLPLHTGIFRNKKIFPVVMTTGMRIEIMLEEAKKCKSVEKTFFSVSRDARVSCKTNR